MEQPPAILPPFSCSPTLASYNVPITTYLSSTSLHQHQAIATTALIFSPPSTASPSKILILQRAATDSSPNKWETPGGGVDTTDATILHGVAREVLEETGLRVTHITRLVGSGEGFAFVTSRGVPVVRFAFEVEVQSTRDVALDAREHQRFLWAGEEEVRDGRMGDDGYVVVFTGEEIRDCILDGFRLRGGRGTQGMSSSEILASLNDKLEEL